MASGYQKLEVFQIARQLCVEIHRMSLELPKFELYEEGSQVRRSSKSIASNIIEGYCLRRHRNEYLQYLRRAFGSCEETRFHLETLFQTGSLTDAELYIQLAERYDRLGKMLFRFLESVASEHRESSFERKPSQTIDERS